MSYSVGFGNKGIGVDVNFGQGDAISVPVNINSLDTDKVADKLADKLQLPEIDTTELAKQGDNQEATNSKILEEVQKIVENTNILFSYNATSGVLTIKNTKIKIE